MRFDDNPAMRIVSPTLVGVTLGVTVAVVCTSAAQQPTPATPSYEVVSIKRNTSGVLGNDSNERPDGGFTMLNVPVTSLISRGYPGYPPIDMVNLPERAFSDRYDVSATSPLRSATPDQRSAMMRAMLADRFKLVVHFENRDQPVYDLMLARADGRLGPAIKPSEVDCAARDAAERAALEAARAAGTVPTRPAPPLFDPRASAPPCTFARRDNGWEGDFSMAMLAQVLRAYSGRLVVDKTGLMGSYRLSLTHDRSVSSRGPDVAPSPDSLPSVFVAVREQLGLKLEPSKAPRETLIIDRLERPTEN
jgi:uncharacterized protein (TIGR03435 family)